MADREHCWVVLLDQKDSKNEKLKEILMKSELAIDHEFVDSINIDPSSDILTAQLSKENKEFIDRLYEHFRICWGPYHDSKFYMAKFGRQIPSNPHAVYDDS